MKLVGHRQQVEAFTGAWRSGRVHHAWLLSGPRGIGKRTFAAAAARMVLSGTDSFAEADSSEGAAKFDAGAHPDFRLLQRQESERSGKLAQYIVVDQVRTFMRVLAQTPSLSDWRVVVVDSACEMNAASANAFLKSLEEPPKKTVFFLVCHSPGRLLPTVRSRCRMLRFQPLGGAEVRKVLEAELGNDGNLAPLVEVAAGRPGRALRFAGLEVGKLMRALEALEKADDHRTREVALELSSELSRKPAQARYEAFLELVPAHIAEAAKRALPEQLEGTLRLWEEARDLAGQALAKSLDPGVVTFQLARLVGQLNSHERQAA